MALSKAHSSAKAKCHRSTLVKAKVNSCRRPQSHNVSKGETKFLLDPPSSMKIGTVGFCLILQTNK